MKVTALAAVAAAALATSAQAQQAGDWIVHLGPALVDPDESASLTAGGAPVPGGNVSVDAEWSVEGEVSYFLTPNFAISAAAGFPPEFTIKGAGSLAGVGTAGKMTGGPAGIFAQYHFNRAGRVSPYVGAGVAFLVVFSTEDAALTNVEADSAVGTSLQAGANIWLNDRWGAFVDVKKVFIETESTGSLGGAPVKADVTLDPLVTNFGVAWRF
ncbi:OmpW/AlkL family protein [Phenylobacterium sp.]|uniref:OmpW/AlkL family protein n=1 Tax=Phenylobacterium sp. TaxID=1871053 RepID=UPI002F95DFA0